MSVGNREGGRRKEEGGSVLCFACVVYHLEERVHEERERGDWRS